MRSIAVVFVVLFAGCTEQPPAGSAATLPATNDVADAAPREPVASAAPTTANAESDAAQDRLPGEACTPDGYWSFFEAFVRTPGLRARYSDATGRAALGSFDIAQQDSRWVRATDPGVDLDIEERREPARFEVAATPVQLDTDDEIVRTLGETRHYRFVLKEGCWRFAGTR